MRIPIKISLGFFITSGFIGFLVSRSLIGTLIWMGIIFVSILVHEFGHALTAKGFGQDVKIELIAFGGATIPSGPSLSKPKEFLVVLAGPLFGFGLFLLSSALMHVSFFQNPIALNILGGFRLINLFWTIVNLLPILPLDGGQLMRIIFESIFGPKGKRIALLSSLALAIVFGLWFLVVGYFIIAILFFLFAFQNFELARLTKGISKNDDNDELKEALISAETAMLGGKNDVAQRHLEYIRAHTKEGIIYTLATEYLAQIKSKHGSSNEVYDLLNPIQQSLSDPSKIILQKAAFDMKDYTTTLNLSGPSFQADPSIEVAVLAAKASAALGLVKASIGWLSSAKREGLDDFNQVINSEDFNQIRENPDFKKFSSNL